MKKSFFLGFFFVLFLLPSSNQTFVHVAEAKIEKESLPEKIKLRVEDASYDLSRPEIENWFLESSSLGFNENYHSEMERVDLCEEKQIVCQLAFSQVNQAHLQRIPTFKINRDSLEKFIKDLARKFNREPENAKLKMENGKVSAFSLSRPGMKLEESAAIDSLLEIFSVAEYPEEIILPAIKIEPEISTADIENMGLTDLIGEGRSNFSGSPKNRIHNIKVATGRFDGLLIKPQEEFSFVKILGEVDGEHGYLPELVIKHDKTEPEFGGGICQVSTTVFRAAINSGLEITARKNHAYPVSYYNPQGFDATVYVPRPDLKSINDTPGYILIQTEISGNSLIFYLYGTNDGRKVNVIGPKILEKNPDGSMKTTFTQQIFNPSGDLIREDVFNSNYDSPNKFPHPGEELFLTEKPKDWSEKQWKTYKKNR